MNAIDVEALGVDGPRGAFEIVREISFSLAAGEVLGIVGESGCGKSTIALSLLGAARAGARIAVGTVSVDGRPMLGLDSKQLQARRGRDVAFVPQDPTAALNPALRIGRQLREMIEIHAPELSRHAGNQRIRDTLVDVRLPTDAAFLRRYPHQLSGGQQQRVAIAMAAILRPRAIVMDEPTTGLDVTTQAHVLRTVRDLCNTHRVAIVYVSHDLAVVGNLADRFLVIYAGRVVESGRREILEHPVHPYTRGLVGAIPVISEARHLTTIPGQPPRPGHAPPGCRFSNRCSLRIAQCEAREPDLLEVAPQHFARCIRAEELRRTPLEASRPKLGGVTVRQPTPLLAIRALSAAYGRTAVLHDVSLTLNARECVALVGESGSGKTTIGRCIVGLHSEWSGDVSLSGNLLPRTARERSREVRRTLQYIFQSPYNALNPRRTVEESVAAPLAQLVRLSSRDRTTRVLNALSQVSLSADLAQRFPDQLSGGERQRVAIARALVCEPQVIVCDEITSALDVSVQASIVGLLADLRADHGVAMIFVTHNLALVRSIADRVLVLNAGRIVESGPTEQVLDAPSDAYTRALLADTPTLDLGRGVARV